MLEDAEAANPRPVVATGAARSAARDAMGALDEARHDMPEGAYLAVANALGRLHGAVEAE